MKEIGMSIVNGFALGVGLVLAAAFMHTALHMGFCG